MSLEGGMDFLMNALPWGRNGGKKSKTKLLDLWGLVTKSLEISEDMQPQPKPCLHHSLGRYLVQVYTAQPWTPCAAVPILIASS